MAEQGHALAPYKRGQGERLVTWISITTLLRLHVLRLQLSNPQTTNKRMGRTRDDMLFIFVERLSCITSDDGLLDKN